MACPRCLEPITGDFAYSQLMTKTCQVAEGWVCLFVPMMSIPGIAACRMLPLHQSVSHLGEPLAKAVIQAHILTGEWRRLHEQTGERTHSCGL